MAEQDRIIPPPFAGWLDEHPGGGFTIVHDDGSTTDGLTTEAAVRTTLARIDRGELPPVERVIRVRHVIVGPPDPRDFSQLFPPDEDA
jgi:hypothetical protein